MFNVEIDIEDIKKALKNLSSYTQGYAGILTIQDAEQGKIMQEHITGQHHNPNVTLPKRDPMIEPNTTSTRQQDYANIVINCITNNIASQECCQMIADDMKYNTFYQMETGGEGKWQEYSIRRKQERLKKGLPINIVNLTDRQNLKNSIKSLVKKT